MRILTPSLTGCGLQAPMASLTSISGAASHTSLPLTRTMTSDPPVPGGMSNLAVTAGERVSDTVTITVSLLVWLPSEALRVTPLNRLGELVEQP